MNIVLALFVTVAAMQQSNIVFTGTVVSEPPLISEVPAGTTALNVIVDEVMVISPELDLERGDHVTVAASEPSALAAGSRYTFFTAGIIFGQSLGVREIAHEDAPAPGTANAKRASIAAAMQDAAMQERVSGADAVIMGEVMSVTTPPEADSDDETGREHNPQWRDAQVKVTEWMKGSGPNTITVRFPASRDVLFYDVPKLHAGEREILFLHHLTLQLPTDEEPVADAPLVRKAIAETAAH